MGLFGKKHESPAPKPQPAPPKQSIEDSVFNMKFTAKQLGRLSKKSEAAVEKEKRLCRDSIQKGNQDGARIHAENAIRNRSQAVSYLRLQARLDAVASKLEGQAKMQSVTSEMKAVTGQLGAALDSMNLEEISSTMNLFEKQFEDLDLQAMYVDGAIGASTSLSTPADEVNQLVMQVADEHNLDVRNVLDNASVDKYGKVAPTVRPEVVEDDLEARLAKLTGAK
eukprot:Plantae.Rhodophyta-Rhodochaete_pulchella.ctg274.p2 GENE.Plantae.Rhodophyta-Rhodochaete_pulchella.ctg274~~Plantae.Rhodophyta-Rhodochaete_pulchella.ctg274.p2  ORF type:complete len:224 (-),score=50.65 Plantae.Rhodophyta-Rhodochaete_pulchella.ctg274:1158-1829(-)